MSTVNIYQHRKSRKKSRPKSKGEIMKPHDELVRRICVDVFIFSNLTVNHILRYFPAANPETRYRDANRLLKAMEGQKLIRRFSPSEIRGRQGGSSPKVITLDRAGAHIVSEELAIDLRYINYKQSRSEGSWTYKHTLAIADYATTVREAFPDAVSWVGETELKREPVKVTLFERIAEEDEPIEREYAIIPDGLYTISDASGTQHHYFLELDCGTTSINKRSPLQKKGIVRKIRAYEEFFLSEMHQAFDMDSPPIIAYVTTGTEMGRMNNMKRWVENTIEEKEILSLFWFTTIDKVTPSALKQGKIWHIAGREGTYSLFEKDTTNETPEHEPGGAGTHIAVGG